MEDKELYRKKRQAKLDEWKAEIDKLKAKARGASSDVGLKYNEQIRELETKQQAVQSKLEEIGEASEDSWESIKDRVETDWEALKTSMVDTMDRLKD